MICDFFIRLSPRLLPVLGPLERYMTPKLDAAVVYFDQRLGAVHYKRWSK